MKARVINSNSFVQQIGTLNKAVGKMVKDRRIELGLTRKEVCLRTGLDEYGLSRFENGKEHVGLFYLQVLFKALKIDLVFQPK